MAGAMGSELIISVSGVRGIVGENLTAVTGSEYGSTFGTFLRRRFGEKRLTVCLGRDSRPSGVMLKQAVTAGLNSCGVDVIDLGIVPTPSVGVMLRKFGCDGGIIITASHNPPAYNGIKLLLENGIAPPKDMAARIKGSFLAKDFELVGAMDCGSVCFDDTAHSEHISRVLKTVNAAKIATEHYRVVLDSVCGAGGPIAVELLKELGCDVVGKHIEPTGIFPHPPEPTAENLTGLCDLVRKHRADIGFAQDTDADRLAIVDEEGTYIGEEYTLAFAAKNVFGKRKGCAAANLSTSRMIDDIAEVAGSQVIRTPVGEANVAEAMVANDCVIGGEGNGGVIDLRVGPVRDSLVGMALVLELMADSGKGVSGLAGEIGGYAMIKEKFAVEPVQVGELLEAVKEEFQGAKVDTADGYRFDFADGWLHLRASNTEPIMRAIAEAGDEATASRYIEQVEQIRRKVLA